jgi:hypothetical protein
MSSTRSTRLRRVVAVSGAVAACAAGVVSVMFLLEPGLQPESAAPPTATAPPAPPAPTTGGGGGGGGGTGGGGGSGGDGIGPPPTSTAPSVDDLLAELKSASAAFNSPASMNLGDATEVELLVSRDLSVAELQTELEGGDLGGEQVRVSETMEAQLAGVGFAIQQITPAVQLVGGGGTTRWKWAVEAEESGRQRLHLTLSAIVDRNGRDRQYTIRTFARTLDVDVTLQDRLNGFFGDNWQWLWATLLVPLVGWLLQRHRHRKTAAEPPPPALQP